MSELEPPSGDPELERRLDAAFASLRPRPGLEARVRASLRPSPPWWRRPLIPGLPGLPVGALGSLGALAAVLVVALVAVPPLLAHLGPAGGSSPATAASQPGGAGPALGAAIPGARSAATGGFGRLPAPTLLAGAGGPAASGPETYTGPARFTVTASLPELPTVLPVLRYPEPSAAELAAAGTRYGGRAAGTGLRDPAVLISPAAPAGSGGVSDPVAAARDYLAGKGLAPAFTNVASVAPDGAQRLVRFQRQFSVPGLGPAGQVDRMGDPAGATVSLDRSGAVVGAEAPLPLVTATAEYRTRSARQAAADAVAQAPPVTRGPSPAPAITLSQVSLVYVAVAGGSFGYFEPALLFSGSSQGAGGPHLARVLVPALAASELR